MFGLVLPHPFPSHGRLLEWTTKLRESWGLATNVNIILFRINERALSRHCWFLVFFFLGLHPCARPYSCKKSQLSEAHTDSKKMTWAISGILWTPVHVYNYQYYSISHFFFFSLWIIRSYDRGEPVEVQNCRKITDHFRGISRTFPNLIKENRRMSKSNRLDLQTLGSQPVMPKKNPRSLITSLDWGEPVVGYRWTVWVWEITGWSSRLQEITDNFRGIHRILCPNLIKEKQRMWTCNRLDLQTLRSQPVMMSKNLPDHWSQAMIGEDRQLVTDEPVEFEK